MGTITTFDLDRFAQAAEERDAATQLSMYGPDAVVTINNKISQPGTPRVRAGLPATSGYRGREMPSTDSHGHPGHGSFS